MHLPTDEILEDIRDCLENFQDEPNDSTFGKLLDAVNHALGLCEDILNEGEDDDLSTI